LLSCQEHSREAIEQELATLDFLETQIESAERRLEAIMKVSVGSGPAEDVAVRGKDPQHGANAGIGRVDRFSSRRTPARIRDRR